MTAPPPAGTPYATATGTTYIDSGVTAGATYYYTVAAIFPVTGITGSTAVNGETSTATTTPHGGVSGGRVR